MKDYNRIGCSMYGASMGRRDTDIPRNTTAKLRLYRVPLNSGGYDPGGAYWGTGTPLYCAELNTDESTMIEYFRAYDREDAKSRFPSARFYR